MKPACPGHRAKPRNWAKQVEVATALAAGAPGPVRLDLYTSGRDIYFSEFTYTTSYCGYLLPKFIWFWARHPALWVGMIVLLTLKAFHTRKRFVSTHKNIKI